MINETLETLNIAIYCTICHLRPLRNKYPFELSLREYIEYWSIPNYTWNSKWSGYPNLQDWSNNILRVLDTNLNCEHKFNYKLVEYTHYAIAWYNNSFDKSHGRTREYCLNESQRWANLAIGKYMETKQ